MSTHKAMGVLLFIIQKKRVKEYKNCMNMNQTIFDNVNGFDDDSLDGVN